MESIQRIKGIIEENGLNAHISDGQEVTIIGVVGDKAKLIDQNLEIYDDVDKVVPVTESYKLANKKFHPEPSKVKVGDITIGADTLVIMSGPCAVESKEQLLDTAHAIKKAGAHILRGGAYKPRTSPYAFQGLEEEGLAYMKEAREETGLPVVCEVTSLDAIELQLNMLTCCKLVLEYAELLSIKRSW